ncbi:hypothetical protein J1N35_021875 [Gossypium stocksii]|uniref:Uncharacterized protein n=1 Tax=Gossypium stocksii TaxID=47602 RepID=A0A9D3VHK6_9ROSI|nr:hypothetical protein J1N35_021875 [Gossypium stocksii]
MIKQIPEFPIKKDLLEFYGHFSSSPTLLSPACSPRSHRSFVGRVAENDDWKWRHYLGLLTGFFRGLQSGEKSIFWKAVVVPFVELSKLAIVGWFFDHSESTPIRSSWSSHSAAIEVTVGIVRPLTHIHRETD